MESERKKNVCTHPNTKSRITGLESTLYNLLKCCYCNCLVGSVIQEFLVLERSFSTFSYTDHTDFPAEAQTCSCEARGQGPQEVQQGQSTEHKMSVTEF